MPDDDILAQVSALLETNIQTYKEELRRTASQGSALRQ
jgi:hypothetical protein